MGILNKVVVAGVAKKLYDESRKPENQRKIQEAMASLKARKSGGQPPRPS